MDGDEAKEPRKGRTSAWRSRREREKMMMRWTVAKDERNVEGRVRQEFKKREEYRKDREEGKRRSGKKAEGKDEGVDLVGRGEDCGERRCEVDKKGEGG
ncbi:hypothetical protein RF55_17913 [Lasius niger]|uniref:Uncharacterized protein n=1 Tax=Lasius niger TaxID=67767 RepID=A0A0J7K2C0_LASNI|nr:hypothetical protein RF55_17913 [Lasius niger]